MKQYDIAVIGAGAMGSAAAYHLAKSGKKILVLDRYAPPHSLGSSHGESRIIREAYFEHPMYVPLVRQAYALWNQLEQESGKKLFLQTGGLMISD
ncbi:MAG: FAD-dependent oxidoreductase, partial [Chitinophagales bacterium]|nr:FAD-dependent oxidoreductase [Chitinophagales bacterium]